MHAGNAFYGDIRAALSAERDPNGEPSASDFINLALPDIIDEIADRYDDLPFEPTTRGVRMLIAVSAFGSVVVYATDTPDDVVHPIAIEIHEEFHDRTGLMAKSAPAPGHGHASWR